MNLSLSYGTIYLGFLVSLLMQSYSSLWSSVNSGFKKVCHFQMYIEVEQPRCILFILYLFSFYCALFSLRSRISVPFPVFSLIYFYWFFDLYMEKNFEANNMVMIFLSLTLLFWFAHHSAQSLKTYPKSPNNFSWILGLATLMVPAARIQPPGILYERFMLLEGIEVMN